MDEQGYSTYCGEEFYDFIQRRRQKIYETKLRQIELESIRSEEIWRVKNTKLNIPKN